MKKLLLLLVLVSGFATAQTTPKGEWYSQELVDEFGDKNGEAMTQLYLNDGEFSNSATNASKLAVLIRKNTAKSTKKRTGNYLRFKLYEYGDNLVEDYKYRTYSVPDTYFWLVRLEDGSTFKYVGSGNTYIWEMTAKQIKKKGIPDFYNILLSPGLVKVRLTISNKYSQNSYKFQYEN